ncbi:MAG TPA: helix-turn-helix domain-containing protein [Mycobacteriales bacterium]|nr:helix-turn-helix domain-containing protein [Mycobacteriales bacterium]
MPRPRLAHTLRRLERASGALATQSVSRMDEALPWFRSMPADQRSWVTLVAQAGIAALVEWMRNPAASPEVSGHVFAAAPRDLARSVSLQQVVALVKVTVEVVEEQVPHLAAPGEEQDLREAVLRFSREVAFAAAHVYARAAENRGAWDARLQAMLIDALVRGDAEVVAGRSAGLGWADITPVSVAIGNPPPGDADTALSAVERAGRRAGADLLAGIHSDRLIVILGRSDSPAKAVAPLLAEFGTGPVVVGHAVPTLADATASARAALAAWRAVSAWPNAPRPVAASELLPERVVAGDPEARAELQQVYADLTAAGGGLLETLAVYFDSGNSLEGAARLLFVHPNTVRYRLRRVADVCALSPSDPRDAFSLRLALVIGRMEGPQL